MIPKELQEDFRKFLFVVWMHLRLPPPTKRQYEMAYWLQHGPKRAVLQAFRGIGKSWITAAFVLWLLCKNPNLNIMVVSASKQRAENTTVFMRRLIDEMEMLQFLRPKSGQRDSKSGFDVGPAMASQTPSVVSLGITSQLTGNRADIIIPDDIEVANNSDTQLKRAKLSEQIKEFDAILKPLNTSRIIYLGTPQSEDSVYSELAGRGFTIRIWPAEYPDAATRVRPNYGERLAFELVREVEQDETLVGKTTEPARFTDVDLMERKQSYGAAGYSLQFLLDTSLSDADKHPLKMSDLLVMPLDHKEAPERLIWAATPERCVPDVPNVGLSGDRIYSPVVPQGAVYSKYTGVVMSIDPSGRGKDETAYAVVAFLNGMLFLLDAGAVEGFDPESLETLAKVAQRYNVTAVITETNYGGGMFTQLFQPVLHQRHKCVIEEIVHSRQKELRIIDTLEPITAQHRLVVDQSLITRDYSSTASRPAEEQQLYRLFYQYTRITRERGSLAHDDRLDAFAMAVGYWVANLGLSPDASVERAKQERLEKELEDFMDHTKGHTHPFGPTVPKAEPVFITFV